MKYPKWFIRLRWIVFSIMCIHVLAAVAIHYVYSFLGGHSWDPPFIQLAQAFLYIPVWIIIEVIRMVLRFCAIDDLLIKVSSLLVVALILFLNTILVWKSFEVLLRLGFIPFLGNLLVSLVYDCWFYIPALLLVYSVDLLLVRQYLKRK